MARATRTKATGEPSAPELIVARNAGREPERLAMKYRTMRSAPFPFLRGTTDLFYRRLTEHGLAPDGPPVWSSGDQHLENFGTYLGSNRLAYFDLNDFDGGMLAPAPWDVLRLVTSLLIAAPTLHMKRSEIDQLSREAAETWRETLVAGKTGWIERRTADGIIGDLLTGLKKRDPVAFLDKRTVLKKGVRTLRADGRKMLPVPDSNKQAFRKWLHEQMDGSGYERGFFTLLDAARRVAGVDSLGSTRFALLIEGTGSPNGNLLLEVKSAQPSAGAPFSPCRQPNWQTEAHRIVDVQKRCEAVPPDFLRAVVFGGEPCIVKLLQPEQDKLDLIAASTQPERLGGAVHTMAQLVAWAHLRSSGRQGSATTDELIAFGAMKGFGKRLLEIAHRMEEFVLTDWKAFCAAYDAGDMGVGPDGKPTSG